MAGKGWTAQVAAAAGAAAGTSAAQLGLGYGLGVIDWPTSATTDDSVWLGSLGWATWIAASATVFGAVLAARMRAGRPDGPWRFALAAAAAIGSLLTVALIALPARFAVRGDTFAPEAVAGGYAIMGLPVGLAVAYWAAVSRPVAANLITTAVWLWVLAAAATIAEVGSGRSAATYLTSWQFADQGDGSRYGAIHWPSALLTMLAALLVGLVAAWPAVRRGELGIGTAASGAVGPLLVAAAFLLLAPQLTGVPGSIQSAYLIAPYAVLAGLAGSAGMVALGRRADDTRAARKALPRRPSPRATGVAAVPPAGGGTPDDDPEVMAELPVASAEPPPPSPGAEAPAVAAGRPRSTVAAPPSTPPFAVINPSREGERTSHTAPAAEQPAEVLPPSGTEPAARDSGTTAAHHTGTAADHPADRDATRPA